MATYLITGGTGMVGTAITNSLVNSGNTVIILSRSAQQQSKHPNIIYKTWNVAQQTIDETAISQSDYVIHVAGANVAEKRWTAKRKQEIVDSRVETGKLLSKAITTIPNQIKAVVSASAIGWYPADNGGPAFTENLPAADNFLGQTCVLWEASLQPIKDKGIPVTIFRLGIVLHQSAGALKEFLKPLQFRVAAILGSGTQIISWISLPDAAAAFIWACQQQKNNILNLVASQPLSNKTFNRQLAQYKFGNKYINLPVPSFILKLMLGEMSVEVLKSSTVSNQQLLEAGFVMQHPNLNDALIALLPK
jgi:uncharacterized protein